MFTKGLLKNLNINVVKNNKLFRFNYFKTFSSQASINIQNQNTNNINNLTNSIEKPKLKIKKLGEQKLSIPHFDIPFIIYQNKLNSNLKENNLKNIKAMKENSLSFNQLANIMPKTFIIKTKHLKYSCFKLNPVCKAIRGKYVTNALDILSTISSKGSQIIQQTLKNFLEKENKNIQSYLERTGNLPKYLQSFSDLKIEEAYVGKKKGGSIPHIRGRSKVNMITKHLCRLNLVLRRVDGVEFFTEANIGKVDPTFSQTIRTQLFSNNANLSRLRHFSFLTSSKGKYYRKTQFKRAIVMLREKYRKEFGVTLASSVIESNLKQFLGFSLDPNHPKAKEFFNRRESLLTDKQRMIKEIDRQFEQHISELDKGKQKEIVSTNFELEREKDLETRQNAYASNIKRI